MHFSKTFFVLLPSLTHSASLYGRNNAIHWSDVKVTTLIPTNEEMDAFYPELALNNVANHTDSSEIETFDSELQPQQSRGQRKFIAGTVACVAYFSFKNLGAEQIKAGLNSCNKNGYATTDCFLDLGPAVGAHAVTAIAGYAAGDEFLQYFLGRGGALQAIGGVPPGPDAAKLKERASCTRREKELHLDDDYSFRPGFGLKLAARGQCAKPRDAGEMSYIRSIFAMIFRTVKTGDGGAGKNADDVEFLIFDRSSKLILGRFHLKFLDSHGIPCPIPISGGDSCRAPAA